VKFYGLIRGLITTPLAYKDSELGRVGRGDIVGAEN